MSVKLQLQNKIMNGAFDFWQRNTSFAAIANNAYHTDRFHYIKTGAMVHTIARSTDIPAGSSSVYSLLATPTTIDASIAAGDYVGILQHIEGNVLRSFKSKKMVMTFWVKAFKAGTYCISLRNGTATRSIVLEYTINASNTWEKKTVRFTHDASGTWAYDAAIGLTVVFVQASGSTFNTTAGTWQTGQYLATSNQVNGVDSLSNTFQLADICLVEDNEGQTRDPDFVYAGRDYFEELQLCQRYYEKSYDLNEAPGTINGTNGCCFGVAGTNLLHAKRVVAVQYKVRKRVAGIANPWGPYSGVIDRFGVQATATDSAANMGGGSESHANFVKNGTLAVGEGDGILFNWTCDAEL